MIWSPLDDWLGLIVAASSLCLLVFAWIIFSHIHIRL
jgi:hypothetical protein